MTLTFISNYINHHQKPLSDCLYEKLGENYRFVQTEPMAQERKDMGWEAGGAEIPYLVRAYEAPQDAERLLMESDVVIFGGCEDEERIIPRLLARKLTFRYSERIYKDGQWKFITPRGLKQKYHDHTRFRKAPVYLLCAGAYVASDFSLVRAYPGKMLRWGYFPEFIPYPDDDCHAQRLKRQDTQDVPVILWAGRFLELKHPEYALRLAADLRAKGIRFELRIVGGGDLEPSLKQEAENQKLTDCVHFLGYLKPEQVRTQMEQADIYLFTSDYKEGWGAVLNEAMNSGCAVVANRGLGAAPYLIKDGVNGFLYKNEDYQSFKNCVCRLLEDRKLCLETGKRAYETIRDSWNPDIAAGRLLRLIEKMTAHMDEGKGVPKLLEMALPEEGPLSVAPILSPGFLH